MNSKARKQQPSKSSVDAAPPRRTSLASGDNAPAQRQRRKSLELQGQGASQRQRRGSTEKLENAKQKSGSEQVEEDQTKQTNVHSDEDPEQRKRFRKQERRRRAEQERNRLRSQAIARSVGLGRAGPNVNLAKVIEVFRRQKKIDMMLYVIFLLLFNVNTLLQRDVTEAYHYSDLFRETILANSFPNVSWHETILNVSSDEEFWDYISTVIPTYLFQKQSGDPNYVYQVNKLAQPPRIRQIRVIEDQTCDIPVPFRLKKFVSTCYPAASSATASKVPIPGWPPGQVIEYQTAAELNTEASSIGILSYDGDGFAYDFPFNASREEVLATFQHWRSLKWVDLHTRAVFFSFVVYNAYNRFFLSVTLLFEFLPYGKVAPTHSFRVFRMGVFTSQDYFALTLDALTYFCAFLFAIQDVLRIAHLGIRDYFYDVWHILNWVTYTVFLIGLVFKFKFMLPSSAYVNGIDSAFVDFEALGWTYSQIWNWNAFNSVFLWLKAISFIKYTTNTIAFQIYTVLETALRCCLLLCLLFVAVFGFALAFHTSVGVDVEGHEDLINSIFLLFRTMISDQSVNIEYDLISNTNGYLGPILIVAFAVLCTYILKPFIAVALIFQFSKLKEKGIFDPIADDFRATLYRDLGRLRNRLMFWVKKDETERFREEREKEYHVHDDADFEDDKSELIESLQGSVMELSEEISTLSSKIENLSNLPLISTAIARMNDASYAQEHRAEEERRASTANRCNFVPIEGNKVTTLCSTPYTLLPFYIDPSARNFIPIEGNKVMAVCSSTFTLLPVLTSFQTSVLVMDFLTSFAIIPDCPAANVEIIDVINPIHSFCLF